MNRIPPSHEERFYAKLLLQNKKIKTRKQIRYISIAASLALFVALPLYFYFDTKNDLMGETSLPKEVREVIITYQTKLNAEIEEIKTMACYTQMQKEIIEIQKENLPVEELAILPIEKQLYYIEQIYTIKIEAVQYMMSFCNS